MFDSHCEIIENWIVDIWAPIGDHVPLHIADAIIMRRIAIRRQKMVNTGMSYSDLQPAF